MMMLGLCRRVLAVYAGRLSSKATEDSHPTLAKRCFVQIMHALVKCSAIRLRMAKSRIVADRRRCIRIA